MERDGNGADRERKLGKQEREASDKNLGKRTASAMVENR